MSPRKKVRPNPLEGSSASTTSLPVPLPTKPSTSSSLSTASGETSTAASRDQKPDRSKSQKPAVKQVRKSTSWYGSLGRKTSASTQIAKETIMGGSMRAGSLADFSRFEPRKVTDISTDSDAQSIRTMPQISENEPGPTPPTQQEQKRGNGISTSHTIDQREANLEHENPNPSTSEQSLSETPQRPSTSSGWFTGWFGATTPVEQPVATGEIDKVMTEAAQESEIAQTQPVRQVSNETVQVASEATKSTATTSSWLGSWWGTSAHTDNQEESANTPVAETPLAKQSEDAVMEDAPAPPTSMESQPSAGSTWAFWSRDTGAKNVGKSKPPPEQGELAVMGERSEASPRRSIGVKVKDGPDPVKEPPLKQDVEGSPTKAAAAAASKKSKRTRPQSMDLDESTPPRPTTPITKAVASKPETLGATKSALPNLLLPSFGNTYRMKQNPSIIKQIAQFLLRTQQSPTNHVHLVKEPPRIKKAIAIGIHGLFPATYLRPMVGQPTGTSIRFANHCAEAIRKWADDHGCGDCEIEKVALEGEGKIADRVDNLWKLLLNWIEHIRSADLILLACHSQGVPVGLMLVSKLIDLGILPTARIGICAMAGVSLGPFPDYKSSVGMLMGTAAELWQFADPQSEISQRLEHAMMTVLEYGVRVTFIGSLDDQLVPMESAIYSPAAHPYIYRAVFVDGRVHAPDFIAHLVGFALKLRNLGISDQGLIRELSVALAGSLYSGEGHSRLYDEEQVYDLAVSHALETTVVSNVTCRIDKHERLANPNPYILPWIMRGLLEEDFVKTELSTETAELLRQFDDWKPVTKALKDIKFRLEAVRSRL